MTYPINAADFINAYEVALGGNLNEQSRELVRAVVGLSNKSYEDGFAAGKEASRHE